MSLFSSTAERSQTGARRLVPEVIQTSGMDCGPACLNAFLAGFGIHTSYGRLREACQTDVDGTSIDTMEVVANQLGLQATQRIVPIDHLLLDSAGYLPAILVVVLPNGFTHFVVVWRRHLGGVIQVMDPATGRRWPTMRRFLDEVYLHTQVVPAAAWRDWAGSDEFLPSLGDRLRGLGVQRADADALIQEALSDPAWKPLAGLDAATRMAQSLITVGGLDRGPAAAKLVASSLRKVCAGAEETIPESFWTVRPPKKLPPATDGTEAEAEVEESEEELAFRGAVLVSATGALPEPPSRQDLSPELIAALDEPDAEPGRELWRLLGEDGLLAPLALIAALGLAATGVITEALLFRGLLDLGTQLATATQRLGLVIALLVFFGANRLLHYYTHADALGIGRRLETRLRLAFLAKVARLDDRYFRSRPVSDMAERAHNLHKLRDMSKSIRQFFQYFFESILTVAGMIWIHPAQAPMVLVAAAVAILLPLAFQPRLAEQDLKIRTHLGALSRFYLDAMRGLVAVRTHTAERTLRREHESLMSEWARARIEQVRILIGVESFQIGLVLAIEAWIVLHFIATRPELGGLLLLAFWSAHLPARGRTMIYAAKAYLIQRNVLLRLLEPLGALELREEEGDPASTEKGDADDASLPPVGISLAGVDVVAGGHPILTGIDLRIEPGEHVAIVGPSGAGKTSLVGLLLGWYRPAAGSLKIDGEPLGRRRLERLRRETAWVDPAVQLWNRSLLSNLSYGNEAGGEIPWSLVIDQAELRGVLEKLPEGFTTSLGEAGGLVSGGEGQRVRLGRAMARPGVRLVILDEPFRGLGRGQRESLLKRARQLWAGATLLCITHDVSETRTFARVAVIDGGRLVEDGSPAELESREGSRYAALLAAEKRVRSLWKASHWRRLFLEGGRITQSDTSADADATTEAGS
jgi:ABC-type bacteriocin/lantibiotic exporter with double-glycine peptidase domain